MVFSHVSSRDRIRHSVPFYSGFIFGGHILLNPVEYMRQNLSVPLSGICLNLLRSQAGEIEMDKIKLLEGF